MIYLLICLIIIFFSYVEAINNSKLTSTYIGVVICIIMLFFVSLRDKVGTDWDAYYDFYLYGNDRVETGYMLFNNFFSKLGIHYNLFLFFLNLISLLFFYKSLKNYGGLFVISLLLFYCELFLYLNFSGIRQAIAISILIYSVKYSLERKFFPFLICVLIAFSFHVTALLFVFSYFVPQRKFKKQEVLLIMLLFTLLSTIVFGIANLLDGDIAYKAQVYLELHEKAPNINQLYLIGTIKRSIIILLVLFFGKKLIETKNGIYFFNLYLIGFGIYLCTYLISPDIGVRMGSYFLIFEIFLAGNLILYNKKLTTRLIIVTIFTIQALYKISTYMADDYYNYNCIIF